MIVRYLTVIFACILSFSASAQLTTNNAMSPEQLVKNVLVGAGVQVSNVTYQGSNKAIGEFNGANSNLGLNHGIIMSSGTVLDVQNQGTQNGPVGPNNRGNAGTNHGMPGDNDLAALVGKNSLDAAVLEFDFIPQGDEIKFRYIFASEEYPEWINDPNFNDAFAFFISGPGIVGQENLAIVPGTTLPVSIGNINQNNNSAYYVDNGNGSSAPQNTDPKVINYDGFTTVLTAYSKVQVCQTYHLKLVISDMSDAMYDSGVFLEAGSLNSPIKFTSTQTNTSQIGGDSLTLIEGCNVNGIIKLTRTQNLNEVINFSYSTSGTATEGVDYVVSPNPIVFAAGATDLTIQINTLLDAPVENDETIVFKLFNQNGCSADTNTFTYTLKDNQNYPLSSSFGQHTTTCKNEQVDINPSISGGFPAYSVTWNHGKNGIPIQETPTTTTTYVYTATDACNKAVTDSFKVTVPNFQPLTLTTSNDTAIACPGLAIPLKATAANGGTAGYNYFWSTGETTDNIKPIVTNTQRYDVTVKDLCGDSATGSTQVTLNYTPLVASARNDTLICVGDTIPLTGNASGGIPPYFYSWNNGSFGNDSNSTYVAGPSKDIEFIVKDSCSLWTGIDSVVMAHDTVKVTVQQPTADFGISAPLPLPDEIVYLQDISTNATKYYWNLGNGQTSTDQNPTTTYPKDSTYNIQLIVEDNLGCQDTLTKSILITPPFFIYVPNAFTPNDDGINDLFQVKGMGIDKFELTIYDRWGLVMFTTEDWTQGWDGHYPSGKKVPQGIYVYKVEAYGTHNREYKRIGHVSIIW